MLMPPRAPGESPLFDNKILRLLLVASRGEIQTKLESMRTHGKATISHRHVQSADLEALLSFATP